MTNFTLEYNEVFSEDGDCWAVWHVVVGGVAVSPGFATEATARKWAFDYL